MEKILDREDQIKLKRNKTWVIIILTNAILIGVIFLFLKSAQGLEKLLISGLGAVSVLAINPIMTIILLLFTDSKDWKKWCFAACIVSLGISILYFYFLF
jgi:hypothetical protein